MICDRVQRQRRAWMRQQRANDLADTALDLAKGANSAADRIILISRSIESFAKDRFDTGERQRKLGRPGPHCGPGDPTRWDL
jgi:hypothetical protein